MTTILDTSRTVDSAGIFRVKISIALSALRYDSLFLIASVLAAVHTYFIKLKLRFPTLLTLVLYAKVAHVSCVIKSETANLAFLR